MQKSRETAGETAIQIFNSDQFGPIRTAGTPENPLFCLVDICKALDLTPSKVAQRLDKGVLSKHPLSSKGGNQLGNFVNEDGLYDVILDSRKPEAKAFRKWVTSVVLPAIRKTGGYVVAAPADTGHGIVPRNDDEVIAQAMQVLQRRLDERERRINLLEGQVSNMVSLCDYLGAVMTEDKTYTMTETAAFLGFGHVSHFLNWCVAMGILYRQDGRWLPMPDYAMKGYFEARVFRRMVSPTDMEESYYTVVTELGRMMMFNKVKERTDEVLVEKGGAL